jgi:hypothetical protein
MKGGGDKMLKYSKSGRYLGFVRDPTGRPVETAPFARRTLSAPQPARPAAEGDRLKAAILLGSQMASSEARRMLAMKARQVRLSSPKKKPE